ncbi:MAG: hypothetical protein P8188_05425 [Gemmatimonadota bacterium]
MGWVGFGFLVVGLLDFVLVWLPPDAGNPEWRFSSAAQGFGALPIPTLGLVLLLVAAFHVRRRWWALLSGGAALVLGLGVLVSVALWVPSVPLALETVPEELKAGLYRTLAQMTMQSLAYPGLFAYLAWMGIRYGPAISSR